MLIRRGICPGRPGLGMGILQVGFFARDSGFVTGGAADFGGGIEIRCGKGTSGLSRFPTRHSC